MPGWSLACIINVLNTSITSLSNWLNWEKQKQMAFVSLLALCAHGLTELLEPKAQISCTSCVELRLVHLAIFFPVNESTYFLFSALQFPGHSWKTNSGQRKAGMTDRVYLSPSPFVKMAPSRWWGEKKIFLNLTEDLTRGLHWGGRKKKNVSDRALKSEGNINTVWGPGAEGALAPPTSCPHIHIHTLETPDLFPGRIQIWTEHQVCVTN